MTAKQISISNLFGPAHLVYLLFCIVGLSAGLWAENALATNLISQSAPLSLFQSFVTFQCAYMILVFPLIKLWRFSRQAGFTEPGADVIRDQAQASPAGYFADLLETLGIFIISLPFYQTAFVLSDISAGFIAGAILIVAVASIAGWVLGRLMCWKYARVVGILYMLYAAGLGAAVWMICLDFLPNLDSNWLLDYSPVTIGWLGSGATLAEIWTRWRYPITVIISLSVICAIGDYIFATRRTPKANL